jgi:hypothetical protein
MEVHPPHGPIHSVKDFMLHLLAITAGLLIALALEASVEWVHHRHLVRKARESISREISNNQQSLARELTSLPAEEKQLREILGMISDVQFDRPSKPVDNLKWTVLQLGDSAWTTASSTGALGYMDYDEARRYSQIYSLQQLYNLTMERDLEARGQMYAFLMRMRFPDRPSEAEFERGKSAITSQLIMDGFLEEMGAKLNSSYEKVSPSSH